ncbi:MAG: alpha-L-fucosidase [Bacteroidales bacterium]|nr:alpha-L-fucosidase [Bacteroidales bacterium]
MKKILAFVALTALAISAIAQVDNPVPAPPTHPPIHILPAAQPEDARTETSKVITRRLDEWQDLKFGFMAHWGIYSQWGVVESWSICSEPWIDRKGEPYEEYKHKYVELNKTFNPKKFDPDKWAKAASKAGMKYMVFTTKHHDGFCMYNTAETPYSSANSSCPFFKNKNSDITGALVNAFRKRNMWIGLYFSKADWHCSDYWAPEWATPDRNVNYDPKQHPERWQRFCDFTYKQIFELTHNYGDIDILWLDGGWIRPEWSINDEVREWLGCQGYVQDINMTRIANMARQDNPDLIIVDRSVGGKYENYSTPEQQVPDQPLDYPWETCMTMGDSWSYVPNDNYKSTNTLIHTLIDVVAKGGNFLLNVGPDANGQIPDEAMKRLSEIGEWMDANGFAIYETRPLAPYADGKFRFTQSKDGFHKYAIYLLDENESVPSKLPVMGGTYRVIKKTRHAVVAEIK